MKKKYEFNGDYCGDIVLIGFTGNATKIQSYLRKTFGLSSKESGSESGSLYCRKTMFNLEISPHVIAHIETYPWEDRELLEIDDVRKKINCPKCHGSGKIAKDKV